MEPHETILKQDDDSPLHVEHEPHERTRWFLASLILLFLLFPFHQIPDPLGFYRLALLAVTVVIMLAGVYVTGDTRRTLALGVISAIPFCVAGVLNVVLGRQPEGHWWNELYIGVAAIPFFGVTFVTVLRHVVRGKVVTTDKLYGAACAYILIGLVWAGLYSAVHILHDPSFIMTAHDGQVAGELRFHDLVYFSFVTQTTLGYGDITPITQQAKTLAILEAMAGVFYLAVLVARLVGLYRHPHPQL